MWKRIGGGCMVVGDEPFPCDDEYVHVEGGDHVTVYSTHEVHTSLPAEVGEISELERLGAVLAK